MTQGLKEGMGGRKNDCRMWLNMFLRISTSGRLTVCKQFGVEFDEKFAAAGTIYNDDLLAYLGAINPVSTDVVIPARS